MSKQQEIAVEMVGVDALRPNPRNPRSWDDKATRDLKASIKKFGFTEPIIVNSHPARKGQIISGHFRWTVAKDLGITEVPVTYIDLPSEERENELLLRMNANRGDWNYELLRAFEIDQLLEVGFSDVDLSHIWDDALSTEDDDFDVEREIKKIGKPKSKTGEIYALGKHRLAIGDALDPEVIKRLVGTDKVSMIYSDPIYNLNVNYATGLGGNGAYANNKVNDKRTKTDYRTFLKKSLENALAAAHEDAHVFY